MSSRLTNFELAAKCNAISANAYIPNSNKITDIARRAAEAKQRAAGTKKPK